MKILRVIASVDPKDGGPIEGLKLSSASLRTAGHETEVVTLDFPEADHTKGLPFKVHPQGRWMSRYGYTPRLTQWIRQHGKAFDAAVIHGLWNHASIGGWLGLKKIGLPYVVFTHGMMDPWFKAQYPLKHKAKQLFWTHLQGKVLRDATAVLFTSEEEMQLSRGVFRGHSYKERVVAYGTSVPPDEAKDQDAAFRKCVPNLGGRRFILFLSRIHEKKGCDLLVSAYGRLAAQNPDVDLVIAGPDQTGLMETLKQTANAAGIAERIHWPGMLQGAAKWGAFRSAEAFILPSHQENFGIVVAEALACGTPVLITNKVNIWREVEACRAGFVDDDTEQGVSRLLHRWFALKTDEQAEIRSSARKAFDRHFRIDAAARDLEQALIEASALNARR
ncbi:glycosyltransferase [Aliirhizobium smilacinae]|uniref:Glycosyltransferase n=1 Tax=Aliirhizobium smilacinae TaxID=1395944 RepID=A0A5C4XPU2_9HYPH|nr:glycosyltransferase [Rhizobium smilacinae]TNM65318.1 glycosyltransferase [Rhizobium smilacinae]